MNNNNNKLMKAKAALILHQPFFATVLMQTEIKEDNSFETFATDGVEIRYNSNFLESLSVSEITFVLCHEILHMILGHSSRRAQRDPLTWNKAADYAINQTLVNESIGSMPSGGLLNSALFSRGKGTAEGIYSLLAQSQNQNQGQGPLDACLDFGSLSGANRDESLKSEMESRQQVKINIATSVARSQGKLSAGLARLVASTKESKVDWREVLRSFVSRSSFDSLSVARPKKRFLADGLALPSAIKDSLGPVKIAIDCSGSIADKILSAFLSEVNAIAQESRPESIEILTFDTEITDRTSFLPGDLIAISPKGGGGTDFEPVMKDCIEKDPPSCLIVLTDLDCDSFGTDPGCPVLWLSYRCDYAPFGQVVKIEGIE